MEISTGVLTVGSKESTDSESYKHFVLDDQTV